MRAGAVILAVSAIRLFAAETPEERFESKIRPLLAKNCYACHTASKLGGLQLDSREGLMAGGKTGPAVVPGDPDGSLLIQAMRHTHATVKMPPTGRVSDRELAEMEAWVREGAVWPDRHTKSASPSLGIREDQKSFWSFQPVRKAAPPAVKNAAWVRSAIDRFVLAKLEERGLTPVREADRRTWFRRVALDLTGLPPSPAEMAAFLADSSPDAYQRVVDGLLASPRYGERWARHWLDIARYSDDVLFGPAPQFYHYRDWVVKALNRDMPYDQFVKAQFAADLIPALNTPENLPALTIFVDTPTEFTDDDRVDVATRGFLGMTVACAQCHDHKYDPIPTKDYYSLLGIFRSSEPRDIPLTDERTVHTFQLRKQAVDEQQEEINEFLATGSRQMAQVFAGQSARYLMATAGGSAEGLDAELLERWRKYLASPGKQHPFLRNWEKLTAAKAPEAALRQEAEAFQTLLLQVLREHRAVEEYNNVLKYGAKTGRELGDVVGKTMPRDRFMLWQEMAADGNPRASDAVPDAREDGVLNFRGEKALRFLPESWTAHLRQMQDRLARLKKEMPPQYPYLTVLQDSAKPADLNVFIRGNSQNKGEIAPRGFLTILREVAPEPFREGSGRLQLAEAIASPRNPLTARVMVNRVWEKHFGFGLVRTPSNFGQTGDRPVHPELLDYLAATFMENGWSLKKLHREIVLSSAYRLASEQSPANFEKDPDNRLLWRYSRHRLDAESLRDSLLLVSGRLEEKLGGPASDAVTSPRRSLYSRISRNILDPMLTLYDFPNPNQTSEQRIETTVPLQRLFLLNSPFMLQRAAEFEKRLADEGIVDEQLRVARAYQLALQREPTADERAAAHEFLAGAGANGWAKYLQMLLSCNEFLYVE